MTLSQRLTRAGLTFILFGAMAALLPSDGNASGATDYCTTKSQSYSVGKSAGETRTLYPVVTRVGGNLNLNTYLNITLVSTGKLVSTDSAGYKTVVTGSKVVTTLGAKATKGTLDIITIAFPAGGRTVTYVVQAT